MCFGQQTECWESYVWLMKGKKESVFTHLSISSCLDSKMRGLQVCTEELISRVKAICFPALCEPCEHFPRSYWDRKQAAAECLRVLSAIVVLPRLADIALENVSVARSCKPPAFFRNCKCFNKAIAMSSKRTAIGWIFRQ